MSTPNSPQLRRLSKKRSFVKKIIPKFLRRSHKHPSGDQASHRSFVVEDDYSSGENWDEDDDVFDSGTPRDHQEKVLRVHVSPTYLNRAGQQIDHVATNKIGVASANSEEITGSYQNAVGIRRKRLEPQAKPKCLIPTAPLLEEVPVESTSGQGHCETQSTSGQGQGETHLTSGQGHDEFQGQSIVGTIQVKLAPDDFDGGGEHADLLRTLVPDKAAEEKNSSSNGIYDFPMFGDESLIHNQDLVDSFETLDDHVSADIRSQKKNDSKTVVMGWGMFVSNEGATDFAADRSRIEDMLLSSSMDDALKNRYSVDGNGWGMAYRPDNLSVNWSINPIKDIFGAFWDLFSVILIAFVVLIMGTAVSIVTVWQTTFMVINAILSVSKWASSVGQGKKRTRPYVAPIRLPSSATLVVENPFKKVYEIFLKPLGAIFFIFLLPFIAIDELVQKAKSQGRGNPVQVNRSGPMNFFRHMKKLKLPHFPKLNWTMRGGRTSVPAPVRIGSIWGRHSGGSRSCHCKCRGGLGKCPIL